MNRNFYLLLIVLTLSGCVGLNSVSMTQIPKDKGQLVEANAHDWVFMNFTTQNDFADSAVTKLKQQCVGGKISGVYTKHQTTSYVLVFKREVIVSGYCDLPKA
ncbi:hypothetical protein [Moritella yayanosii]|uniref:Lipoprotein n=1 Tax=Moritella yayanosii TaxID=69539 RepID=A0A330LRC1_9GAMM|nr:hypothetical protein [Moritella yayanosii]SQD78501.1 conserved protein of unknown function [Moritella yayanosii]